MINLLYHIRNSNVTLEKLSQLTGILPEKLNKLVEGLAEPSIVDVRKISKALKVSIDFLISENNQFQDINLLFRKNLQGDKNQHVAEKCSYVIGNSLGLLNNDYTPKLNSFTKPANFSNTADNASILANEFRLKYFNGDFFSPLITLPEILSKELNCIIYIMELGAKIEGASAIINNVPFIFIAPRFEPRMLFTLAHELAHIIAHHDNDENFALIDGQFMFEESEKRSEESFAHHFAAALLLPAEGVGITLKKVRAFLKRDNDDFGDMELLYLSRIYGVSFEVAASRCEYLGIVPRGTGKSLYEAITKSHGSPEKRAEALNLPSRVKIEFPKVSSNLIHSAIKKINSGELSLGQASEILSLPISDLLTANTMQD